MVMVTFLRSPRRLIARSVTGRGSKAPSPDLRFAEWTLLSHGSVSASASRATPADLHRAGCGFTPTAIHPGVLPKPSRPIWRRAFHAGCRNGPSRYRFSGAPHGDGHGSRQIWRRSGGATP